jgi:hypothetical protein
MGQLVSEVVGLETAVGSYIVYYRNGASNGTPTGH